MAKRFEFRLEVVQRVRQRAVDAQRRVVADSIRSVADEESRLRDISAQLRDLSMETRVTKQSESPDVASLRSQQYYHGWLADQSLKIQGELGRRRTESAIERRKLAEQSKRLQVIEKLRERQWQRFRRDQERREQGQLDEAALQGYFRESAGAGVGIRG